MAVVYCPVSLVKEADAVEQIAQARTFEAVLPPIDLGCAAAPSLAFKDRPVSLRELPVESAVVSDDDHRIVHEGGDGGLIDLVSQHQLVCDSRQRGYLRRDRGGGFVEGGEGVP